MKHITSILIAGVICAASVASTTSANAAERPSQTSCTIAAERPSQATSTTAAEAQAPQSFVAKSSTAPTLTYVGTHNDGELILRVSASGRNKADALAVAEKYALRQVMLTGIQGPDKANLTRPLIFEVNAEEKYEDFFNAFFSNGGVYKNFVSSEDRRGGSDVKKVGKESVRLQTTLRVLRPALREYLIECNIIPR